MNKPAHLTAAIALACWLTTGVAVSAGCVGWIPHLHANITIVACAICGTLTIGTFLVYLIGHIRGISKRIDTSIDEGMETLANVEKTAVAGLAAVDAFNRTVVVPIKETFIHGYQLGWAQAAPGQPVNIPRQVYTADRPTADGATTVELPVITDDGPIVGTASVGGRHHAAGWNPLTDTGNVTPIRHPRPGPRGNSRRRGGSPLQRRPDNPTNN